MLDGAGEGDRIAFDVGVNDFDEEGICDCQMTWHKTMGGNHALSTGELLFKK